MNSYPRDGCDCYNLDDLSDDTVLVIDPSEYWVLNLFVIVLEQGKNDRHPLLHDGKFLVLEHPSYSAHNRGIWSTPYASYHVDVELDRCNKVSDIKNLYKEQCESNKILLDKLDKYRFYHMGIPYKTIKKGREYIEYKRSIRQPNTWKCYFIKESFVYNIDKLGLQNLIDPEGLHAYNYYPIIDGDNTYTSHGMPLATNVVNLFKDNYLLRKAMVQQVDLYAFRTKFKGYIIKFDIVSFTEMMHIIEESFRSFEQSGSQYAESFVVYLQQIFEQELVKAKVSQYKFEGDGFLASIETASINLDIEKDIMVAFKVISSRIAGLLKENKLSFRASVLFGEYSYGKELGLFSKGLVHSGKELIRIARMDSAIKEHISSEQYTEPRIFFLLDSAMCYNEGTAAEGTLNYIKPINIFRETAVDGKLYSLKMEDIYEQC